MLSLKSLVTNKSTKFSDQKQHQIEILLAYLKAGLDFTDAQKLLDIKEKTLDEYVRNLYDNPSQFNVLNEYLSLQDLLKFTFETKSFNKDLFKQILKILTYPMILYTLMYSLMLFFILFLFPSMLNIVELFDLQTTLLNLFYFILRIIFIFLTIMNLLIVIGILLILKRQHQKIFINYVKEYRFLTIIRDIYTHQFAYNFHLFLSKGFSTKLTLELIKESETSYLNAWLATLISYQLQEGKTFIDSINHPLLEKQFILVSQLGTQSNQSIDYLKMYLMTSRKIIESKLKQSGTILKLITYTLLAFLIIVMYQILLAPMSLLGNI